MKTKTPAPDASTNAPKAPTFPAGNAVLLPHPLSETVPGQMTEEEFIALCASIKADGQCQPIVLFEGKILDGRARYKAVRHLGNLPTTVQFEGDVAKAAAFVIDNNLHRRQLNSMQKALVGAHFHMRKEAPLSQKDAAAAVGVGLATLNLAVRLLASNNTPLIKRCEHGDTTRAEIDEILFDREASRQQASVTSKHVASEDDIIGEEPDGVTPAGKAPGNVIDINSGSGVIGKRMQKVGHSAKETAASRCVQHFKGLSEAERKGFVEMAWPWLGPALRNAGKLPKVDAPAPTTAKAKPAKAVKLVKPAKRKAA